MRIDAPPRRLAVLGGGCIAAELAEVFAAAGSSVVIVEKEERLLGPQDETVAERFTELARSRYDLRLGRELTAVGGRPGALRLTLDDASTVEADMLLVAAGRVPNSDRPDLGRAGIATRDDGRIVVDAYQRTTAEGVFALGDICTPVPLKHVANREARVVAHNLRHPHDLASAYHRLIPAAVFTRPQAATLIQPLVLAMTLGIDAATLARSPYWIHPAPTGRAAGTGAGEPRHRGHADR
ncbi:FAD-dependent oxidoreductase [Streptomyces sp. 2.9]